MAVSTNAVVIVEDENAVKNRTIVKTVQQPRVFTKRWLILVLFCLMSTSSSYQWIQYSIITPTVEKYYHVTALAVDWTSMIFMLGYTAFVFPATWLLDKYGLRLSALLGAFGTCLGALVKCASTKPSLFPVTFLGQTIVGCSQVFILGIPPRLAAVWFGPNEVAKATAFGVFGNQVGIAIGFYMPTIVVGEYTNEAKVGHGLQILFCSTAAVTFVIFALIFFFFDDAPPVAPSRAQLAAMEAGVEKNYLHSVLQLLKNRNYVLLIVTYGLNVGVFYGVSTLLSQTLTDKYEKDKDFFGIIGFAIVVAGMFGSVAGGYVLDKTHQYKATTVVIYVFSVTGMLAYSLTIYLNNIWIVLASAVLLGFFMTGYLPVGFEFGAELTYPCSEGTQSGLLNASAQIFGIILVLGMGPVLRTLGDLWCNMIMTAVLIIGTILTLFIKSDLRRKKANATHQQQESELTRFLPSQTEQTLVSAAENSSYRIAQQCPLENTSTGDKPQASAEINGARVLKF